MPKKTINQSDVENAVLTMARVAFDNEKYFGDLDGEMGDADFGKSLATGFRAIQAEFDKIDHSDIGTVLLKCGMIFAANVGGCSGPIWGTAFMRAGMTAKGKTTLTLADLVAMGRNAVQGMMARGSASQGDKTLLDAVIPAIDKIEEVAKYGEKEFQRLMNDQGIIRNKLKINAAIENAKFILKIREETGSFRKWLDIQSEKTGSLEEWTKLFRKNFKFTGGEIVNEFLMSTGYLPGAHSPECPVYERIKLLKNNL